MRCKNKLCKYQDQTNDKCFEVKNILLSDEGVCLYQEAIDTE